MGLNRTARLLAVAPDPGLGAAPAMAEDDRDVLGALEAAIDRLETELDGFLRLPAQAGSRV